MKQEYKDKIKEVLTQMALDEVLKKKVVRKGKLKKVKRAANLAQANKLTGQTPQQRRRSGVKRSKTIKKKGGVKAKQIRKQKRSAKIGKRAGVGE